MAIKVPKIMGGVKNRKEIFKWRIFPGGMIRKGKLW
jgi:hypothetical protein